MTITGIAVKEGHIKGIKDKVLDYFPEIKKDNRDKFLEELTIEHLLTMSAGYITNTMPDLWGKDSSFDTIKYILTVNSIMYKPGTVFCYNSAAPHLISAIIQKQTGKTLCEYAKEKLFSPLGINVVRWDSDPKGITIGNTWLSLKPMDMVKIGYLLLCNGVWNGKHIVPGNWESF